MAVLIPHGVVFDCDGVLIDSEGLASEATARTLGRYDARLGEAAFLDWMVGHSEPTILAHARASYGVAFPASISQELDQAVNQVVAKQAPAIAGIGSLLEQLSVPCAVASNSPLHRVIACLERNGLAPHFGGRFSTPQDDVQPKPAPDVYLRAVALLALEPQDCLAVEDSPTGARAAVAAGLTVIGFLGGTHVKPGAAQALLDVGARTVVTSHQELAALVPVNRPAKAAP